MDGLEKLLSVDDVSEILGLSRGQVYRYCRQGIIPHIKLSRQVRFSPKRIREFLESGGTINAGGKTG